MNCEILILSLMDTGDLIGLPRSVEVGGQSTTVWNAPDWYNNIVDAAWPTDFLGEDLSFPDSEFGSYVTERLDTSAQVSRAELNSLYCSFYNLTNDGLKLHTQSHRVKYAKSRRSVLFLDEFNRAPSDILNASLQLVLDKRLHSHVLPVVDGKPTFVVAAINPANGDYSTMEMDPALLDRFVQCTVEADAPAWLDWARSNNISQVVRDFLAEHPNRIHFTATDGNTSATPRSWSSLATTMDNFDNIDPSVQFQVMKGLIGQELASQFLQYYNNYFKVIKMDDIEALITKKSKTTKDIQKIGKAVNKLIKDQEAIQKQELAEQFYSKYIQLDTADDAKPLIAFLSGLELETLAGFLKTKKSEDFTNYMKLAKFDGELNNKALFTAITTKLVNK